MLDEWQLIRCIPDRYAHPDELAGQWTDSVAVTIPATVGGAGPDDFDWWQRCTFEATEPTVLEFQGLTFPAAIFLDGDLTATCESMFLPVCIDVGAGRHDVYVHFGALNTWLKTRRPRGRWRSSLVGSPGLRWARTTLIGRAPVYGDLPAPIGLWRPLTATPLRLHTRLTVNADAATGAVGINGTTGAPDGTTVEAQLQGPLGDLVAKLTTVVDAGRFTFDGHVENPLPWWPHGYGPQPLYRAVVRIDGEPVSKRPFGFRSVSVSSEHGGFQILVNGVPIFCRGATWTPPNPLGLNVDEHVMRAHVKTFADAGANMVRVVGGLVYEQQEFWDCCAELGVMVWQDAMQATFDPPAEVSELIALELQHVLDGVSGNPALVIVSGGSETLQQPEMLGIGHADMAMDVIDTLLPDVVSRHSDACYVRASPSPPTASDDLAIRPDTGVAHWFGVGGYLRPIADVRSAAVKFAAECLAFANPPAANAVDRYFGSAAVAGHHPAWKAGVPRDRGSSWDFEDIRDFYAREVFGEDLLAVRRVDPERYLQLGRLAIAEAMGACFAFWRRSDSGCSGALVLAGKDMVAGAGWGLLDVDGAPKAALDVLARVWAPVAVILSNDGLSGVRVDIHNDTPTEVTGQLTLTATSTAGAKVVDVTRDIVIPPHSSSTQVDADLSGAFRDLSHAFRFGPPGADAIEAVVRFGDGTPAIRDVLVVNPHPRQVSSGLQAIASRHGDECWDLRVTSDVALRYVSVDAPGWTPSDNVFHLAAGSPYTVRLTAEGPHATPTGTVGSIDLLSTVPIVVGGVGE